MKYGHCDNTSIISLEKIIISFLPFIFEFIFSCLVAVAKPSEFCWIRVERERGYSCLIPDFSRRVLSFSPFDITLVICRSHISYIDCIYISHIVFVMLKYIPSILNLFRFLSLKYIELPQTPFCIYPDVLWSLSLSLFVLCLQLLIHI